MMQSIAFECDNFCTSLSRVLIKLEPISKPWYCAIVVFVLGATCLTLIVSSQVRQSPVRRLLPSQCHPHFLSSGAAGMILSCPSGWIRGNASDSADAFSIFAWIGGIESPLDPWLEIAAKSTKNFAFASWQAPHMLPVLARIRPTHVHCSRSHWLPALCTAA